MKTPIQELYDFMEQHRYFIGDDLHKKYKDMVNKEKEVIENAYWKGIEQWDSEDSAEDYYNETFKNKQIWKHQFKN